jgi:hypothetical protein
MSWMLVLGIAWALFVAPLALLVGRSIRLGDRMEPTQDFLSVPDFVPEARAESWVAVAGPR